MPVQEHPAEHLSSFVPDEYKQQLLKTPPRQQLEDPLYQQRLAALRDNYKFAFIVQWFQLLRSEIRLTNDAFDVEALEEEFLGITGTTFINRFKSAIIHLLTGRKIINIENNFADFDSELFLLLPNYFQEHYKTEEELESFKFNDLDLVDQLDIYYELLNLTTFYEVFRKTVDKYAKPWEELRATAILEDNKKSIREEYFILEDDRLYYRKLEYPRLVIPKTSKQDDEAAETVDELPDSNPKLVEWRCLCVGIYQFDDYLVDLKKKAGKRTSSREYKLLQELKPYIERIFTSDFKRRKQSLHRKKELQLQSLIANRKRSSRLEEKEKRRLEEEEARNEEYERLKREGAAIRASKRQKLKEEMYGNSDREGSADIGLSREERMKLRRSKIEGETEPVENSVENSAEHSADTTVLAPAKGEEDSNWQFDCKCGIKSQNFDDGTAMISCENCNKWQHYACQSQEVKFKLDREEGYHFFCGDCDQSDVVPEANGAARAELEVIESSPVEEVPVETVPETIPETNNSGSFTVPQTPVIQTSSNAAQQAPAPSVTVPTPVSEPVSETRPNIGA
ncbi:unnamed protein product [Kuraishia capsulata CBS 1993]|uniref:Zinc finger PHD-type domain-containing protein n=1 Tax=Kuraishia capsulata CBS 1993 TaxID=1382522 RepID=W6MQ61_9ASCO|nr:uncharacterized protein KUCA_T00004801001 [Kuraishia capsulata CBS 1993]CDK28816.1 unnamed protein product [Kuraishia capsulata CBS 1993]